MTQGVAVGGLLALLAPGLAALGAVLAFASEVHVEVIREGARPSDEPKDATSSSEGSTDQQTSDGEDTGPSSSGAS
jgi:hypothetical protein